MGAISAEGLEALVRDHGGVLSTAEAAKAGLSRHAVGWARRTKVLHPLRRGVYTTTARWLRATPDVRHGMAILAQQRVNPQLVACETSAAIALLLPIPSAPPAQPQLTRARGHGSLKRGTPGARGNRGGQLVRRSRLTDAEIWTLASGIRVTSAVRTVLDCARSWEKAWGLAIADAAIAAWDLDLADLVAAAGARAPAPGHQRMMWVAEHARKNVESPLESLARAVVVLAGLPEPKPQVWLGTREGRFRVDLLDEVNNVIIEADGKVKYASAQDVWREKRREDALRDSGFEVIRFTHADYRRQAPWLTAYRRAMARSAPRTPAPSSPARPDPGQHPFSR
jgi:hypothetical protein